MPKNQPSIEADKSNSRIRLKTGAVLAGLALAFSAEVRPAQAEEQAPVVEKPSFIVGAMEDSVLSEDYHQSELIAAKIAEMGFNTLKISMPWTHPRQCAEIDNDLVRFQNAAKAARNSSLFFMLNLIPGGGNGLGMAPVTASQQRCYKDTLVSYLHAFSEINEGGHIVIEAPNEPNSDTFWRPQKDKDGNWSAPIAVTRLLAGTYQPLKREAEELGIKVTFVGGGLASKDNPGQFIKEMGQAKRELGKRLMDAFGHHPYPHTNDELPEARHSNEGSGTIGFGDTERLAQTLDNNLGAGLPIYYTEYGRKTKVPSDKLGLYKIYPNAPKSLISEAQQADFYSRELRLAKCEPRVGAVVLFNVIDDSDGYWTSGLMYPDLSPKSSYEIVKRAITQASSENPVC